MTRRFPVPALTLPCLSRPRSRWRPAALPTKPPNPGAEPAPVAARLAVAVRLTSEARTGFAGTVAAEKSTAVSSRVMAMVTAVHVNLGDTVAAGQSLVSIDPTAAQGQVSQAQGGLAQAEAALALARRNRERFEALAASKSASELELDMARMQFEQAAGAVQQARGAVDSATSVARESRVVAPFAGRVAARLVEVGDLAAPGRPLVMIESSVGRRLIVAVPETVARTAALTPGQALAVTLDARPDLGEIPGRLAEISPGPDPVSHSYTVKIDLPALDLPAGAAGRAFLATGRRDTVRIPRAALIGSGGLTLVVVRDSAGQAESRVVTVEQRTERQAARPMPPASRSSPVSPVGSRWRSASPSPRRPEPASIRSRRSRMPSRERSPAPVRTGLRRPRRRRLPRFEAHATPGHRLPAARRLRRPGHTARRRAADQGADGRRLPAASRSERRRSRAPAGVAAREGRCSRFRASNTSTPPPSLRAAC